VGTVKEVTIGAATVPVALLKQVCDFFPNAKVWNGYGLTECPSATSMRVDQFPPQMNSIGRPYLNLEVRIMDENRREVPVGTIGEICLRGPIVMKQYFNNEEATRDAFSGEWLRTGDLGKVDEDGFVYIMDRKKDMIISGGENIYSKEVEDVLYNHESILEAAVIGVEDELWGESVRAVIQPKPGATLTEEDVIAFCAGRLAGYKKPKSVVFVDDMPKTASNKILKRELRDKYGTI
jgi:acyl-CoA synthetase (AMP-forming)/AMP-acid ligase II